MVSEADLRAHFTNDLALKKINHHLVNTLGLPKGKYLLTEFKAVIGRKLVIKLSLERDETKVIITLEGETSPYSTRYDWGLTMPHEIRDTGAFGLLGIKGYLVAAIDLGARHG
jgi:hypothetical protein